MVLLNFLLNLTSVFFIISYLKSLCIPLPQAVQSLTLQGITGSLILFLAPDLDQKKKNLEAFAFWKSTDKYLSNGDRNTSCHNECHRARSHGSFLFFFFHLYDPVLISCSLSLDSNRFSYELCVISCFPFLLPVICTVQSSLPHLARRYFLSSKALLSLPDLIFFSEFQHARFSRT